jgi:hypothetical protein
LRDAHIGANVCTGSRPVVLRTAFDRAALWSHFVASFDTWRFCRDTLRRRRFCSTFGTFGAFRAIGALWAIATLCSEGTFSRPACDRRGCVVLDAFGFCGAFALSHLADGLHTALIVEGVVGNVHERIKRVFGFLDRNGEAQKLFHGTHVETVVFTNNGDG